MSSFQGCHNRGIPLYRCTSVYKLCESFSCSVHFLVNPTCLLQLGGSVSAFVQPGTTLKVFALLTAFMYVRTCFHTPVLPFCVFPVFPFHQLRERKDNVKLGMNESADLWFARETGSKSYASLLVKPGEEEHVVNLAVSHSLACIIHNTRLQLPTTQQQLKTYVCVCHPRQLFFFSKSCPGCS